MTDTSKLPAGWDWAELGEITRLIMGQSPPSSAYNAKKLGLPFYQGKADFGELYPTPRVWCSSPTKIVERGDILISVRAPVGPTNFCTEKSCIGRGLAAVRPLSGIPPEYLLFYLRLIESEVSQLGTGTTFTAISRKHLESLGIPIAPLNEQRRIVMQVHDLRERILIARRSLGRIPNQLKRFRQSVLVKAFRGELIERDPNDEPAENLLERIRQERRKKWEEELRAKGKDPRKYKHEEPESGEIQGLEELPNTWTWTTLDRVLDVVQYGTSVKADAPPNRGIPILRMGNIKEGKLELAAMKYMDPTAEDIPKYELKHGDILINRTNSPELVGKSALFDLEGKYVFASYLIRLRAIGLVSPSYLIFLINSPIGRRHIDRVRHQVAGQSNINTHDIRSMPIPLAPMREQFQVAKKIQEMFTLADQVEESIRNGLTNATILEHSLLTKAFRGELVQQDPKDEPASVFLERIRAKRSTLLNKKGRNQTRLELASPAKITA